MVAFAPIPGTRAGYPFIFSRLRLKRYPGPHSPDRTAQVLLFHGIFERKMITGITTTGMAGQCDPLQTNQNHRFTKSRFTG